MQNMIVQAQAAADVLEMAPGPGPQRGVTGRTARGANGEGGASAASTGFAALLESVAESVAGNSVAGNGSNGADGVNKAAHIPGATTSAGQAGTTPALSAVHADAQGESEQAGAEAARKPGANKAEAQDAAGQAASQTSALAQPLADSALSAAGAAAVAAAVAAAAAVIVAPADQTGQMQQSEQMGTSGEAPPAGVFASTTQRARSQAVSPQGVATQATALREGMTPLTMTPLLGKPASPLALSARSQVPAEGAVRKATTETAAAPRYADGAAEGRQLSRPQVEARQRTGDAPRVFWPKAMIARNQGGDGTSVATALELAGGRGIGESVWREVLLGEPRGRPVATAGQAVATEALAPDESHVVHPRNAVALRNEANEAGRSALAAGGAEPSGSGASATGGGEGAASLNLPSVSRQPLPIGATPWKAVDLPTDPPQLGDGGKGRTPTPPGWSPAPSEGAGVVQAFTGAARQRAVAAGASRQGRFATDRRLGAKEELFQGETPVKSAGADGAVRQRANTTDVRGHTQPTSSAPSSAAPTTNADADRSDSTARRDASGSRDPFGGSEPYRGQSSPGTGRNGGWHGSPGFRHDGNPSGGGARAKTGQGLTLDQTTAQSRARAAVALPRGQGAGVGGIHAHPLADPTSQSPTQPLAEPRADLTQGADLTQAPALAGQASPVPVGHAALAERTQYPGGGLHRVEARLLPEELGRVIQRAVYEPGADATAFRVQLVPEHLGQVHVRVSLEQGQVVNAQFLVDNQAAKQALESSFQQLGTTLNSLGLAVGGFSVALGFGGSHGDGQGAAGGDTLTCVRRGSRTGKAASPGSRDSADVGAKTAHRVGLYAANLAGGIDGVLDVWA